MPKKKPPGAPASVRKRRARPAARKRASARPSVRPDGESPNTAMLVGYARVSTIDQNLTLRRDALSGAGCGKIFVEQMSGAVTDRPELMAALGFMRAGDTLVVWKLDRLARSMKQLIETVDELGQKHRVSEFDRSARYDDSARSACFSHVRRARGVRARLDPRAHPGRACRGASGWAHRRSAAEAYGRRPRGRTGDAREPRHHRCRGRGADGVSPATLYRYLPAARTANCPSAGFREASKIFAKRIDDNEVNRLRCARIRCLKVRSPGHMRRPERLAGRAAQRRFQTLRNNGVRVPYPPSWEFPTRRKTSGLGCQAN